MKYDMAGGAAMLGAMKALSELKPAIPVTAVIPSVENMPGPQSQRPGDVVTSMSGKTIEVLNTDAEGRLILADALTYSQKQGCTHLVDAATLTGSIVVALGHERVGVFSNDESWQERFLAASETAGEKMWPMPLDEEYKDQLKSPIAICPTSATRWGGFNHGRHVSQAVRRPGFVDSPRYRRHGLDREGKTLSAGRPQRNPRENLDSGGDG